MAIWDALFKNNNRFKAESPQLGLNKKELKNLPTWGSDKQSVEMPFSEIIGAPEFERLQGQQNNFNNLKEEGNNEYMYKLYGITPRYYANNNVKIGTGSDKDFSNRFGFINQTAKAQAMMEYSNPSQTGGYIKGGEKPFISVKKGSPEDLKTTYRHEPYHNQQAKIDLPMSMSNDPIRNQVVQGILDMRKELASKYNDWSGSERYTEYLTDPSEFQVRVQGINQYFNEQNVPMNKKNLDKLQEKLKDNKFRKNFKTKQGDVLQMLDMMQNSKTAKETFWKLQPVSSTSQGNRFA